MSSTPHSSGLQAYMSQATSDSTGEHVILVDMNNNEIGVCPKLSAHEQGLLHRAFSIFVVNGDGHILMQRRAAVKYHSASRWSNTCCGHPRPNEPVEAAARRRLKEEMGIDCELRQAGIFQYRADVGHGLFEHEIDHLFVGIFDGKPVPAPDEVSEWAYISPKSLDASLRQRPEDFSAWFPMAFAHVHPHLAATRLS